jgi:formylglycine-generating enzyme required for sulfatase activity
MGSPPSEAERHDDEKPHRRIIPRSFAVGTKPVTVEQFGRFLRDRPKVRHSFPKRYSPEANGPIVRVTWYEAAQYCNWLSAKEGIPKEQWCYPETIEEGMKPFPDYLERTGYRLPSEAEWEYSCRAGTSTERYHGVGLGLLPRYSWFQGNSRDRAWPAGQKRPNDLGLFDMHGNVWTWCQESGWDYPDGRSEDKGDIRDITDRFDRVLRGASFAFTPGYVRSAIRLYIRPDSRYVLFGLRVSRTLP